VPAQIITCLPLILKKMYFAMALHGRQLVGICAKGETKNYHTLKLHLLRKWR